MLPFKTVEVKNAENERHYYNTVETVVKSCNDELVQFFRDNPCKLDGFDFQHRFTVNELWVSQSTNKEYEVWYLELEFDKVSRRKKQKTET